MMATKPKVDKLFLAAALVRLLRQPPHEFRKGVSSWRNQHGVHQGEPGSFAGTTSDLFRCLMADVVFKQKVERPHTTNELRKALVQHAQFLQSEIGISVNLDGRRVEVERLFKYEPEMR